MNRRTLASHLAKLRDRYPVVFLTGPWQSGKTTLARATFPDWPYRSLEDLDQRAEAEGDPRGFLSRLEGAPGIVIDEAQRAPGLFSYLQRFVDEKRAGTVLLTGSQNFLLSAGISQSLAGRAAVLDLLPFSHAEARGRTARAPDEVGPMWMPRLGDGDLEETLFRGGYPPIHDRSIEPSEWLDAYIRTYVERDVRMVANVGNLTTFTRFLRLCAGRAGQLLNASALGADAGIDQTTAKRWLSILEASYVVQLLSPHFENFSKRLVKAPKLYFVDTGLLCHLLGLRRAEDVQVHPLRGAVFENFVVSELTKIFAHHGQRPPLFFWRDHGGHEVDVIVDLGLRRTAIEAKSGLTFASDSANGLRRYAALSGQPGGVLVYGGDRAEVLGDVVLQGWAGLS